MDGRCVGLGNAVGQANIARAGLFCGFHETHDFSQQSVIFGFRDTQDEGAVHVQCACKNGLADMGLYGHGFAGHQTCVNGAGAFDNVGVCWDVLTRGDHDAHAGHDFTQGAVAPCAVWIGAEGRLGAQCEEVLGDRTGLLSGRYIEIAPDQ